MAHSMPAGRRLGRAWLLACLAGSLLVGRVAGATPKPITVAVSPSSGAPGQVFTINGSGYAAGTTYGLCILPADKTKCGFDGADIAAPSSFVAAAGGSIPAGMTGVTPNLLAGAYKVVSTAPGTGFIVAAAPFTVTAPTLSISPAGGAAGTVATLTLAGGAPNATYTVCADPVDVPACGGVGIELGNFTTDASGAFPAGTTVRIPGQVPATYHIGIHLLNSNPTLIATANFDESAPVLTLSASGGPGGTAIAVSGSGFAPGGLYSLCLAPAPTRPSAEVPV